MSTSLVGQLNDLDDQIKKLQSVKKKIAKESKDKINQEILNYDWLKNKNVYLYNAFETKYHYPYLLVKNANIFPPGMETVFDKASQLTIRKGHIKDSVIIEPTQRSNAFETLQNFIIKYNIKLTLEDTKKQHAWIKFVLENLK